MVIHFGSYPDNVTYTNVGRNLFTIMKYLILILTTLLIGTRPADKGKSKREKREYTVEIQDNGDTIRTLVKTTRYTTDGKIISEIKACKDSTCCPYNKAFKLYSVKREFSYKDQGLILRRFWSCDSLPVYKNFHEYNFDNRKRLVEKRELTYNFETDSKMPTYNLNVLTVELICFPFNN